MDKNLNTGYRNAGYCNTGYCNTGDRNAGGWNAGYCNTGYCNTGDRNTGDRNTGDSNTGSWNTGSWNTGSWNTGSWNTGSWNTGSWNAGYCNTITPEEILVFNKLCSLKNWEEAEKPNWIWFTPEQDLPTWVSFSDMNTEDKKKYPDSEKLGGYLLGGIRRELSKEQKIKIYKKSALEAWNKTTEEDRQLTFKLPNFDAQVFFEIFGIDVLEKPTQVSNVDLTKMSTDDLMAELAKRIDK